ncbi:MAG: SDR family oxidoreductase [Promethearchaeota archaeon]|nr:MAG: SDR family oxidoreductase [Candidatus Lokiarchaeota archaeon]
MKSKKFFNGKSAVITGAASGIGREFALNLAKYGCNLVISDINMEKLELLRKELEQFSIKVISVNCDVTKNSQVRNLAKISIKELEDIHFLFSNAGIATGGPFEDIAQAQWERTINVNLFGMYYVVKAFIPKLIEQSHGHIIVTASIAGSLGVGGLNPYNTSKFANAGFCESLYGEYSHKGIDVSVICPFPIRTNLIESVGFGISPEKLEGINVDVMQEALKIGKRHYWEEFTKKQGIYNGFAGGFPVERAVKRFIKKIKKKKLYIFERRYGRLMQFLQGLCPGLYRKLLKSFGKRHLELINEATEIALEYAKKQ